MADLKCSKCGEHKPDEAFALNPNRKRGRAYWCKACNKEYSRRPSSRKRRREYIRKRSQDPEYREKRNAQLRTLRRNNPTYRDKERQKVKEYNATPEGKRSQRNNDYKRKYGITQTDYDEMLKAQNYSCKICGIHIKRLKQKRLYIDHDHKTGEIRGLLCNSCNHGLRFVEDGNWVQNARNYLMETIGVSNG